MTKASRWLTTRQVADLLGVKLETVYAYVSRGVLTRQRGSGMSHRRSPDAGGGDAGATATGRRGRRRSGWPGRHRTPYRRRPVRSTGCGW
ncbi:MAG: helix-turn-helix domain-containing protein, partial [Actinopolymorphaceae bacterium]